MVTRTYPILRFFDEDLDVSPRIAATPDASAELETARRELLDQIEQGFTLEDSGTRAEVPDFAKAHLKAMVEVDC